MAEKKDFRAELAATARKICTPGKGILAADESVGTLGKKFVPLNVKNTEENRRAYREVLFTTPGLNKYVSGVILFEETTRQATKNGKNFVELLRENNIVPGIKVDKGV
jgi:fructose-bisphosphate aldolase class I